MPASSTPGVGTPLVLQLATFSLFPHMAFLLCVHGDRERERTRDLVTPPLIRMSDPLGLGPHSYNLIELVTSPKSLSPLSIILEIKVSTYVFRKDTVQSTMYIL